MLRLFVELPLAAGAHVDLPPGAVRHVQVRRLQPGDTLCLFDGRGGEWPARVTAMSRSAVQVELGEREWPARELGLAVTLAIGMPANERMDALVEKATELGAAALQPLVCERSVLRPEGERAERRRAHWQAIAVAAAEQCGRTHVPRVEPVLAFERWLAALPASAGEEAPGLASDLGVGGGDVPSAAAARWVLSPGAAAGPARPDPSRPLLLLSGPEGGLSPAEQALAERHAFRAVALGPRVLRADTAPLAVLAWLGLPA